MQRVKACDVPVSWCPTGTCLTSRSRPPTRPCETDRPTQQHGVSTAAADYKRGQLAEAADCGSLCHSFGELSCRQVDSSVGEMSIGRLHTYSHTVRYVGYSAALLSSGRRSARSVSLGLALANMVLPTSLLFSARPADVRHAGQTHQSVQPSATASERD